MPKGANNGVEKVLKGANNGKNNLPKGANNGIISLLNYWRIICTDLHLMI